jgi:hypothetical protein
MSMLDIKVIGFGSFVALIAIRAGPFSRRRSALESRVYNRRIPA